MDSAITPAAFAASSFDYLIVGGGTAGLALAARLTDIPQIRVGVLEAGVDRTDDPTVLTPGFAGVMYDNPDYDWIFKTVPQTHGNNRIIGHPQGKQLGGSSAINRNFWTHASRQDIDNWGALGNPGWSWKELFPYFLKSETYNPPPDSVSEQVGTAFIEPAVHGRHGPIQNSFPPFYDNFYKAFEPTYQNLGLGPTGDPKGGLATGAYTTLLTVDPKRATRSYAANTYYKPNAGRPNLVVLTGVLATKVVFAPFSRPLKATGVNFEIQGQNYTVSANNEIILSAGAFQSPQLLELSGIGTSTLLESKGIEVLYDNPNVGENLQDHVLVPLSFQAARGEVTFEDIARNQTYFARILEEYTKNHTGPLTLGVTNAYISFSQILHALKKGPVLRSLREAASSPRTSSFRKQHALTLAQLLHPNETAAQEISFPGGVVPSAANNASALFAPSPETYPGKYFSLLAVLEHPFSRGSVHITSSDPTVYPAIDPNYFSHPLDIYIMSQILLHSQQVARTPPLSDHLRDGGKAYQEGFYELNDKNVEAFARSSFSSTYHPAGTCAMGPRAQGGVVDEKMKVHGTQNLRVVDASVFPAMVRGNLVSLVYAVAERAADFIKEGWDRVL